MRSAYHLSPSQQPSPLRRRVIALALTLLAHALLLLLLLRLAPPPSSRPAEDRGLITFDVALDARKAERPRTPRKRRASEGRPKPPTVPPPPVAPAIALLIPGLEHFDLRQVRSSAAEPAPDGADQANQESASAYGPPGEAPGGGRLYNAEWYREPTSAELALYLPDRRPIGWGMIACQTTEKYHVDNCRELGNDPPGSGLAGAIRQAAWQFLVRPPRINGRPILGAWVRIRIEFTESGAVIGKSRSR